MNEEKKEYQVSRATLALALGALGSRGVGFFREIAVAATFGTGRSFDLYVASSAFPSFLSAIFLYALPDYLVPYFARLKERRLAALRRFLFSTFLGGAVFLGALYFSAPLWIKVVAPGLAANEISLGAGAFQILLLFVFSTVLEAVLRSYYQVEGRFGLIAWSPLLTGLVVLGSVFLLSGKLSVYALAWGWAVGGLVPVGIMLVGIFFFPPSPSAGNVSRKEIESGERPQLRWKNFLFVLAVTVLGQMIGLLDRFFGSYLPSASLSALYYASLPVLFPVGLLVYPLGYAVFPKLAQQLSEGRRGEAGALLGRALGWVNFVLIPMTVLFCLMPGEIIQLVFQRGAFDTAATGLSARCLRLFALSLLASGYIFVLSRALLAAHSGKKLAGIYFIAFLAKAAFAYLGVRGLGLEGLAAAGSLSLVFMAALLFRFVPAASLPFSFGRRLGREAFNLLVVSLLVFGVVWAAHSFLLNIRGVGVTLLEVFLFAIIYFTVCAVLKIPEALQLVALAQRMHLKGLYGAVATGL